MLVRSLSLSKYRNYDSLQVEFHPACNILVGKNAQGKTNLLEAIFYAVTGKSHRTSNDPDLISRGEKVFHIILRGERCSRQAKIEIMVRSDGKKRLKVNNQTKKKISSVLGTINTVIFSPEDIMLVKGGPSIRRRFLDTEISQTSPFYCHNLVNYNRVLLQRNNLLRAIRERREKAEMLEAWDLQLAEYGTLIIQKRAEFIEKLGAIACSIHREITGGREELKLVYLPSVKITTDSAGPSLKEYFFQELRKNRETEINRGITIQGPHRDEIEIKIGETNLKAFGSQGQQRTSAVSIKLSEMELMKKETGEYPVLLLDDVMSELDAGRRKFLLSAVSREAQLFVTTTNLEEISSPIKRKGRIYEVKNGQLFILQEG